MLTILILFLGMIKVEIDSEENMEGPGSQKMLLVMDLTTLVIGTHNFNVVILIVMRKASIFELEVDQRTIYLPKQQRTPNPCYIKIMLNNK
jgi:hypothetical protein